MPGTSVVTVTGPRLSPSRAADFKTCPLLFRFRAVDQLTEAPSEAAVRGTVVHAALDGAFDLPPAGRTPDTVRALLAPALDRLVAGDGAIAELIGGLDREAFLAGAGALVDTWFTLEDPARLSPAARERYVECRLDSGLTLRGIVDRLDEAPDGSVRVVDYKTGRAPGLLFEQKALFQVKFYATVLWRSTGVVPAEVMLVYLASGERLRHRVDPDALPRFEAQLPRLWEAVERAARTGDFRPRPSRLCDWCDHRQLCPAFGNTPPPLPADAVERLLGVPTAP
ncbi:MAG: RecB family exonuclease [Kineosporiaceae bacterium]